MHLCMIPRRSRQTAKADPMIINAEKEIITVGQKIGPREWEVGETSREGWSLCWDP